MLNPMHDDSYTYHTIPSYHIHSYTYIHIHHTIPYGMVAQDLSRGYSYASNHLGTYLDIFRTYPGLKSCSSGSRSAVVDLFRAIEQRA